MSPKSEPLSTIVDKRYRVDALLGRGAASSVFSGDDLWRPGHRVALKILNSTDATAETALRQEFSLLFRMRHPHLISAHELGRFTEKMDDANIPPGALYLVEDLCEGVESSIWAGSASPTPSMVATVGAQIAAALATLAARGIRHRDVKPGNILVDDRKIGDVSLPWATLIDLGLAERQDSGTTSGTPRYMAPEALDGCASTASDIFSLGCSIASMLDPSAPMGDLGSQQDTAHLTEVAAAMTHPVADRRCSASESFDMLRACAPAQHQAHLDRLRNDGGVVRAFCGGSDIIEHIDRVVHAEGGLLRIAGESGSGKTAALGEAVSRAVAAEFTVGQTITSGYRGDLGIIDTVIDALERQIEPAPQAHAVPEEAATNSRWAAFAQRAARLEALSAGSKIAIFVDDVAAESPLDQFAEYLFRRVQAADGATPPRIAWFQSGGHLHDATTQPLDTAAIADLITVTRPLRPHDVSAATAIAKASRGLPCAVVRLLGDFPGDALPRAARDSIFEAHLTHANGLGPQRNVDSLASGDKSVLQVASLFSSPVHADFMASTANMQPAAVDQAVAALVALGHLRPRDGAIKPRYEVADEALRRSLWQHTPATLIRTCADSLDRTEPTAGDNHHRDVARWWMLLKEPVRARPALLAAAREATSSWDLGGACGLYEAFLATFEGAGQGDDSEVPSATQADDVRIEYARVLLDQGRPIDAAACLAAGHDTPALWLARAEAAIASGSYDDVARALEQCPASAPERPQLESLQARACMLRGDFEKASEFIAAARARVAPHPEEIKLLATEGLVAFYRGQAAQGRELLQSAAKLAESSGGARSKVSGASQEDERRRLRESIDSNLGLVLQKTGNLEEAERSYRRAIDGARQRHDLPALVMRLSNLAALLQERARFDDALSTYTEAESLARLIDGRREQVRVTLNRANLLAWLGNGPEATKLAHTARTDANALDMKTEAAYLSLLCAELQLVGDTPSAGLADVETARRLFQRSDHRAGIAECDSVQAQVLLCAASLAESGDVQDAQSAQASRAEAKRLAASAAKQAAAIGRARLEAQALIWLGLASLESTPSTATVKAVQRAVEISSDAADPHMGWLTHAILMRFYEALNLEMEATFHRAKARQQAQNAHSRLSARYERSYASVWYRRALWAEVHAEAEAAVGAPGASLDQLLAINRELAQDHNPESLLERIIDAAIALSGAERGFIVLVPESEANTAATSQGPSEEGSELLVKAARNIDRESLNGPQLNISRSIAATAMRVGTPVSTIDALGDERFNEYLSVHALKLRSVLCLPLRTKQAILGALYLDDRHRTHAFSKADIALLSAFGDQAAIALSNARRVATLEKHSLALEHSRVAIEDLNARLQLELKAQDAELEHARLGGAIGDDDTAGPVRFGMVGQSPAMRELFRVIERVADKEVPVAIGGESGTGKELVARAIHSASDARSGPFISVNCGAIPGELLESELFGHERGAFTGAVRRRAGLFELAENGTLLLDEIGDMPIMMQVKLLRVLQQREFRRVGGTEEIPTNARIVSASNRDLELMVREGSFREDLWYRLNVVEMHLPPLRERKEDLPPLIDLLLRHHSTKKVPKLGQHAHAALLDYDWPGNIRELENELLRAIALAGDTIGVEDLSIKLQRSAAGAVGTRELPLKTTVEKFEQQLIEKSLAAHSGKVSAAAKALGLTRAGLYKKINKYSL